LSRKNDDISKTSDTDTRGMLTGGYKKRAKVLRVIVRGGGKYDGDVLRYKKYVLCIQIKY